MIQSLFKDDKEYFKYAAKYNTYNTKFRKYTTPFRVVEIGGEKRVCGPPPCYVMGNKLTATEIFIFNREIDAALKAAGLIK